LTGLLKRITDNFGFKARHYLSELAYLCSNSVRVTSADDTAAEPVRSIYIVNLALLAFLFLLSPDKIPYVLGSNQQGFAIFDILEEISAFLKRAIPF